MITQDFLDRIDFPLPMRLTEKELDLVHEAIDLYLNWHHPISEDISMKKEVLKEIKEKIVLEQLKRKRVEIAEFVASETGK